MNRAALAAVVMGGAIVAAYAMARAADARALPADDDLADTYPAADPPLTTSWLPSWETQAPTGTTALDYVNPWGAIKSSVEGYRVDTARKTSNMDAFLSLIAWAEGTDREPDPYRVCYAYRHTIRDLSEHPAVVRPDGSREWAGERLSEAMCRGAGLSPGCVSTAAGRYQIIRGTWLSVKRALRLPDFGPESQDRAAVYLIRQRRAVEAVERGDITEAIRLCRAEWASLPGNTAGQPQRRADDLLAVYTRAGGQLA